MMTKMTVTIGAALLAACGTGGGTSGEAEAQTTRPAAKPLDISGVRPGIATAQARTALEAAGWNVAAEPDLNWEERVAREAMIQGHGGYRSFGRGSGIGALRGTKGAEELVVSIRPTLGGGEVSSLSYAGPMAGRSPDQAIADLRKRYGAAPVKAMGAYAYCTPPEQRCTGYGDRLPSMAVKTEIGGMLRLSLNGGSNAEAAWQTTLNKAVAAKAGGSKNSF